MTDSEDVPAQAENNYHLLIKGVAEFNEREFFEAHETLEDFWRTQIGDEKELVQSIIQAAVAYYHFGRDNSVGATKLFKRAITRAESVPEGLFGLDTNPYLDTIRLSLIAVESGADKLAMPMPIIRFKSN